MIDDTKNDVLESRLVERLDETADIATLSSEQRDAAWQKVLADVTKKIATTPLPDVVRQAVVEGIALLDTLQQEIAATKQGSMLKRQAIRDKIEALKGHGKVQIDEQRVMVEDDDVKAFVKLLDDMIVELDGDKAMHQLFINPPDREFTVLNTDPDSFAEFVLQRVDSMKRHVKIARRDLAVSYSRYCFGFDRQMKQLEHLEYILKLNN